MGGRRREVSSCRKKCFCCKEAEHSVINSGRSLAKRSEHRTSHKHKEAVLRNRKNNDGLYEDVMLYVKDQPITTRKRGRPKKVLAPIATPVDGSPEVIYVPSLKQGIKRFVPVVTTTVHRVARGQLHGPKYHPSVKCGAIQPAALHSVTKPVLAVEASRPKQNDGKIDWPDDLKDLVSTWDTLPESYMRNVVKWLLPPISSDNFPPMITTVHSLVNELGDNDEQRLEELGAILKYMEDDKPKTSTVLPPKVVVEAEPSPLQPCGQWSSMAENQENCAP